MTPANVRAYVKYLSARGYAFKTVSHHLSVLRLILDFAVARILLRSTRQAVSQCQETAQKPP
ncbi:MAG: hypothetical protein ACLTXL_15215 [Clostridia bacterium]